MLRIRLNSATLTVLALSSWAASLLLFSASALPQSADEPLGVLKIVSARKMTPGEYQERVRDFIGATYLVRLRFEAPQHSNVYLYAPYCGKPLGYVLERSGGRVTWLAAPQGQDASQSPGFKQLDVHIGSCWLLMTADAAYEWEEETEPTAPKEQAQSVFVKRGRGDRPTEIISNWYAVPAPAK
jgi:hypothetical protein